jgi:hypothetical protein
MYSWDTVFGHQNVKDSVGTEKVQDHHGVACSIGQTGLLAIVIYTLAAITLELHSMYFTPRSPTI